MQQSIDIVKKTKIQKLKTGLNRVIFSIETF